MRRLLYLALALVLLALAGLVFVRVVYDVVYDNETRRSSGRTEVKGSL